MNLHIEHIYSSFEELNKNLQLALIKKTIQQGYAITLLIKAKFIVDKGHFFRVATSNNGLTGFNLPVTRTEIDDARSNIEKWMAEL